MVDLAISNDTTEIKYVKARNRDMYVYAVRCRLHNTTKESTDNYIVLVRPSRNNNATVIDLTTTPDLPHIKPELGSKSRKRELDDEEGVLDINITIRKPVTKIIKLEGATKADAIRLVQNMID